MTLTNSVSRPLVLFLVPLVLALPFLTQAFHIDDRIYLEIAGNIGEDPLYPYDYVPLFEGLATPDAASHSHLPLTSYYLALVQWATGSQSEWVLHLAFLPFLWILTFGFHDLSKRFVELPLAATLLLLLTPSVFVLSHTLMTEIPLLALWVLSVSRILKARTDGGRPMDWVLGTLALLGAAFISLLSFGLVVLFIAALAFDRSPPGAGRKQTAPEQAIPWLPVLVMISLALLLWFAWYLRAYLHYDRFVLLRTLEHLDKREAFSGTLLLSKLVSFLLNLGALSVFPAALWLGFARRRIAMAASGSGLLTLLGSWLFLKDWDFHQCVLLAVFLATGLLGLLAFLDRAVAGARGRGEENNRPSDRLTFWVLLCWFAGILACYVLLYPSGSVRYLLLAVPPLVLIWMRCLEERFPDAYLRRNLVGVTLCLSLVFSGFVAATDYQFADMYRKEGRRLIAEYSRPRRTVWFTAEWGLRYYLEAGGARYLMRTSVEPDEGDIILKPYVVSKWVTLYDKPEFSRLIEQRPLTYGSPLRLLDFSSQAGFYSTAWGLLPLSWSAAQTWEWVNVFEVLKQYDGPVPESERHW